MFKKIKLFFQIRLEQMAIKSIKNSIKFWEKELKAAQKKQEFAAKALLEYRKQLAGTKEHE